MSLNENYIEMRSLWELGQFTVISCKNGDILEKPEIIPNKGRNSLKL